MERASARASAVSLLAAVLLCSCGGGSPVTPTPTYPAVRAVSPATGTTFGGTEVTITGDRFVAGSTVTLGGVAATGVVVESATTIRATTPPHASGLVDVAVSGSTGGGVLSGGFTYVAPAVTKNAPPVIKSLTVRGRRTDEPLAFADLAEVLDATAVVEDAETAPEALGYAWTAAVGTFSGTGTAVTWTAPAAASTPAEVVLTLTVTEKYRGADASGLPVDLENVVTSSVTVALHDSAKEVGDMAYEFLAAFSDSSIGAEQVVHDFSTLCAGRDDEFDDVTENRARYLIQAWNVGTPRVTVEFGGLCALFPDRYRPGDACALVSVRWTSLVIDATDPAYGRVVTTQGTDQVAGIFQGGRWWLCSSDYKATTSSSPTLRFKR